MATAAVFGPGDDARRAARPSGRLGYRDRALPRASRGPHGCFDDVRVASFVPDTPEGDTVAACIRGEPRGEQQVPTSERVVGGCQRPPAAAVGRDHRLGGLVHEHTIAA